MYVYDILCTFHVTIADRYVKNKIHNNRLKEHWRTLKIHITQHDESSSSTNQITKFFLSFPVQPIIYYTLIYVHKIFSYLSLSYQLSTTNSIYKNKPYM